MSENNRRLDEHLKYLKLPFIRDPTSTTSKNSPTARPPSAATARSNAASKRRASR